MTDLYSDLTTGLGDLAWRVAGVRSTACIETLGGPNLQRVLGLLGEAANRELSAETPEREALHAAQRARVGVEGLVATGSAKPMLPRLRAEHFHVGQEVAVYLGDTIGEGWASGRVQRVDKWHKREWTSDPGTRGFYWRVTAVLEGAEPVVFSTTEPRVLLREELGHLTRAFTEDLRFLAVFVENAARDWQPLWNIERGVTTPVAEMPYARWLMEARLSAQVKHLG